MATDLKPCFSCEGAARLIRRSGVRGKVCPSKWYRERVECKVCGLTTREYKKPSAAAHSWNTRSSPSAKDVHSTHTLAADPLAGLVRWKHCEYPNHHKMIEHKDGEYVLHSEAAAIFSFLNTSLDDSKQSRDDWKNLAISLSGELEKAKKEINTLLNNYVREHFFENKTFQPLSDLIGQISQLDNAITITRDFKNRAEKAEREVERLKEINANLMGDDEDVPRYTTKRLKHEIEKAIQQHEQNAAQSRSLIYKGS